MKLNLACGSTFIDDDGWVNFDFSPLSPNVRQANLLNPLPVQDSSADIIYSSHFLEHVPRNAVPGFLNECKRLLKPGGSLRIVVPDLEEICRTYLTEREAGRDSRADFVAIELIDQCVRKESGGELGRLYSELAGDLEKQQDMVSFVSQRTGHDLTGNARSAQYGLIQQPSIADRARRKLSSVRLRVVLALLPAAFRSQNVSLAETGETHQWMWDYHMLGTMLRDCGFVDVTRQTCRTSGIADFPVDALDLDRSGQPRKGASSLYVEARKPES